MTDKDRKESSNLSLWDQVSETNPQFTKPVSQGSRQYTSICPTYQAKIATEHFGLYGHGWGLSKSVFNWDIFEVSGMVLHEATFFYTVDSNVIKFDIQNAEMVRGKYKNGDPRWDTDFAKKLETNTISKALAKLGFSSDIFMGKFEDRDYVAEQNLKAGIEAIEQKPEVVAQQKKDFFKWCEDQIANYPSYNESALKGVYGDNMKKARAKCDLLGVPFKGVDGKDGIGDKFEQAMKARLNDIKQPTQKDQ